MAQHTRRAIQRAFVQLLSEMPFDRISVVGIARESEVTRNTIYYYYEDVYALLGSILDLDREELINECNGCSWQDYYLKTAAYSSRKKREINNIRSCDSGRAREMLYIFYYSILRYGMENYVRKEADGLDITEGDMQALIEFNTTALYGILDDWISDGMKNDAESHIQCLNRMLKGNVRSALERVNRTEKKDQ